MVTITGNTYPVREKLRALGGRPVKQGSSWVWLVPDDKAAEAQALVAKAGAGRKGSRRGPRTCRGCGCRINYGVFCGKCEFGR